MALGIVKETKAIESLNEIVREDPIAMVRSRAVIALGQVEAQSSLPLLREKSKDDPSGDVRHQCELAIDQIEKQAGATPVLKDAFLALDESSFGEVAAGQKAPDFELEDTGGNTLRLSVFRGEKKVVLIWVFADWCPVCHGEFHDLILSQNSSIS